MKKLLGATVVMSAMLMMNQAFAGQLDYLQGSYVKSQQPAQNSAPEAD